MTRDIILGQYYSVDSVLHKIDLRTKLFGTMVFIISLLLVNNVWAYAVAILSLVMAIKLSRVPSKLMVKGLKAIVFLLLISVSFNLLPTDGEVLVKLGFLKITGGGIRMACSMGLRPMYLVMGSSIMVSTTTPNELTDGLERGLDFLKKIKAPVHEVSMMMSTALRFIPVLIEETDRIMRAQMARGADSEGGNPIQKAKSMVSLSVSLFTSAFRRAMDLAMAIEARCYYGGEGRTGMKPLKCAHRDGMAYLVYVGYPVVMVGITRFLQEESLNGTGENGGRL